MESNQGPRTERLTEASPPGRATEAHGDARAPLTTKPSSSSPSVGIKKAPTGRASSPSLSPRSIKLPPSRRPPSVASSSADGDNRKVPKPWWEALARLAFELRGEAAAQRAAHTTDLGILQQQQLALRARARIDKLQNAVDSGGGGSTLALSGAALGAVAPQRRWSKRRATRRHCSACWNGALHGRAAAAAAPAECVALCDGDPVRPVPTLDARRSRSVRRDPLERPAQRVGGYARLPLRFSTL